VKKLFLLIFIVMLIPLSFLLLSQFEIQKASPSSSEIEVIQIESMITPPIIKTTDSEETLLHLKLAVSDALSNDKLNEEEEANEVLALLKESVPFVLMPIPLPKEENLKVIPPFKKKVKIKKHKIISKKVVFKRRVKKHEIIKKKKKILKAKQPVVKKLINHKKREKLLDKQENLHFLSIEERKKFKNFEVVFTSKPFTLEDDQEMKYPQQYTGKDEQVKLEELLLVKTLGVVAVSRPYTYENELIER